jgi:hypothetical protein
MLVDARSQLLRPGEITRELGGSPIEPQASVEIGILGAFLVAVVFGWDGLVRRHIRLMLDVTAFHISLRGLRAVLFGGLWLTVGVADVLLSSTQLQLIAARCHQSVPCVARTILIPPFTTWYTIVGLLIEVGGFCVWARGALDRQGPFRSRWIAPGVWMSEKETVARASQALQEAHLPTVDPDTILVIARWVRQHIALFTLVDRRRITHHSRLDPGAIEQMLLNRRDWQQFKLSQQSLRTVIIAIAEYYRDLDVRGGHVSLRWSRRNRQGSQGEQGNG